MGWKELEQEYLQGANCLTDRIQDLRAESNGIPEEKSRGLRQRTILLLTERKEMREAAAKIRFYAQREEEKHG